MSGMAEVEKNVKLERRSGGGVGVCKKLGRMAI